MGSQRGKNGQGNSRPMEFASADRQIPNLKEFPLFTSSRKALLVPGAGYPDSFAWPFGYTNEIVPMLWDVWPRYWPRLISSLKRHHVQTLLCTSSQVCEYVAEKLPHIHAVHVPEGIDPHRL